MKVIRHLLMFGLLALLAAVALQLYFAARIGLMAYVNPESTAFQRTEAWRVARRTGSLPWRQQWVPYAQVSDHLKRAIIASEDASFTVHDGVDMEALEKAWAKNQLADERAAQWNSRPAGQGGAPALPRPAKIVGGSTITQQLAKNLFLSGERTLARKGQELLLTLMLENLLDKQRILEIYLNHVEWGEGVFGAEAAAQHYFRKPASRLNVTEAARLAVMLPRPRYFETHLGSAYLAARARTISARMGSAELP